MKKILNIILLGLMGIALSSCTVTDTTATLYEAYEIDFEFYDDYMYDLETGIMEENINFAISSRENSLVQDIDFNYYQYVNYMLCWSDSNYYIGYYSVNSTFSEYDTYLGDISSNDVTLPEGVAKIAFMVNKNAVDGYFKLGDNDYLSYTYEDIFTGGSWGDYVLESIDDNITVEGFEDYTYRDIFGDSLYGTGKTNLSNNGDFSNDNDDDGLADSVIVTGSPEIYYINANGQYIEKISGTTTFGVRLYDNSVSLYSSHNYFIYLDIYDISVNESYVAKYFLGSTDYRILQFQEGINTFISNPVGDTTYNNRVYIQGSNVYGSLHIKEHMIFDLTDIFGTGNEPELSEFEDMLSDYERINQYGDGEITLSDINSALWQFYNLDSNTIIGSTIEENDYYDPSYIYADTGVDLLKFTNLVEEGGFTGTYDSTHFYYHYLYDSNTSVINNYTTSGNNLFDKNTITIGYYVGALGEPVSNNNSFISDYIEVKSSTTYNFTQHSQSVQIAEYDISKNNLGRTLNSSTLENITTTEDTAYIRISYFNNGIDIAETAQIEEGTTATDYEAYIQSDVIIDLNEDVGASVESLQEQFLEYYPDEFYYDNAEFLNDDNSDNIADNWSIYNYESVSFSEGLQTFYKSTSTDALGYIIQDIATEDAKAGDYVIDLLIDEIVGEYYFIIVYNDENDAQQIIYTDSYASLIENDIKFNIPTMSSSNPELLVYLVLDEVGGTQTNYYGSGEYIVIDYFNVYNENDINTIIKTDMDANYDYFKIIDMNLGSSEVIPNYNGDNFDKNIFYFDEATGLVEDNYNWYVNAPFNAYIYYYLYGIYQFAPWEYFNTEDFETYFSIYYNNDYNNTTNLDISNIQYDNTTTKYLLSFEIMKTLLDLEDSDIFEEDIQNILDYYWDYKNNVQRYEWYTEFGVTEDIFDRLYEAFLIQSEEDITLSYSSLDSIEVTLTRSVTYYEDDSAMDNINDIIDFASPDNENIRNTIVIIIIVLATILAGILGATFTTIFIIDMLLILLAIVIGWIAAWLAVVIGAVLILILVLMITSKRGSD